MRGEPAGAHTPVRLTVAAGVLARLRELAAEDYPIEVAGVLAGYRLQEEWYADRLHAVRNQMTLVAGERPSWPFRTPLEELGLGPVASAEHLFLISSEDIRDIDAVCRREGRDILGFVHSHPDGPAEPSAIDLKFARMSLQGYLTIIVSVLNGIVVHETCWILREDGEAFERVPLDVQV